VSSSACPEEGETQHHLGAGHGYGPVRDEEGVLFAVFSANTRTGDHLTGDLFSNNQLKNGELSVARRSYTTAAEFHRRVVAPAEASNGSFMGVARAWVGDLRKVVIKVDPLRPESTVRAICVIDRVSELDYDGHAALKYADLPGPIAPGRLGALRSIIREDLASRFEEIVPLAVAYDR
jgi:hypothetical protein